MQLGRTSNPPHGLQSPFWTQESDTHGFPSGVCAQLLYKIATPLTNMWARKKLSNKCFAKISLRVAKQKAKHFFLTSTLKTRKTYKGPFMFNKRFLLALAPSWAGAPMVCVRFTTLKRGFVLFFSRFAPPLYAHILFIILKRIRIIGRFSWPSLVYFSSASLHKETMFLVQCAHPVLGSKSCGSWFRLGQWLCRKPNPCS